MVRSDRDQGAGAPRILCTSVPLLSYDQIMAEFVTVFWSEDSTNDWAMIGPPRDLQPAILAAARHGNVLPLHVPDWLNRRLSASKAELRNWLATQEIQRRSWIGAQPMSHYYAQLTADQAFGFRMRWL